MPIEIVNAGIDFDPIKQPIIELITDPQGAKEVTSLEALAFNGDGEDIFTIAAIGKIGWIWGTRDNGQLIGAIEMIRENEPSKAFIHGVIINPDNQYKGLGSRLVKYAEEQAIKIGFTTMECTIATTNGPSLNVFINKNGYSATKFIPNCYGDGAHRLWVSKDLASKPTQFDYNSMLIKQNIGEKVFFVEDDDFNSIKELLSDNDNQVIGIVERALSGKNKNLLCITPKQ